MTQKSNGFLERRLENRLQELRGEFETGQKQLASLESQAGRLRETLLRIAGAIQVLEEELGREPSLNGAVGDQAAEPASVDSDRGPRQGSGARSEAGGEVEPSNPESHDR